MLLTTTAISLSGKEHALLPQNGIMDLRGMELSDETILNLNGEWIFYWRKFLTPQSPEEELNSGITVSVPSYWNSYVIDGENLPGMGYGTYGLSVILPPGLQSAVCFDIPVFDVAYKLYINNRMMASNGKVGTSMEEEEPCYDPASFCYIPDSDTLHIMIQVSNFHHRRGGYWQAVVAGSADTVLDRKEQRRMFNYSTIGVLFFFMIFFLIFWSFSRREVIMLLFALTTMGILMRSVNTGLYFSNYFIDTSWAWQIRMEYLGSYLGALFGMLFLHRLFPRKYMNRIIQTNTILITLASISLFILPVHLFTYEMLVYQPLLVIFLGHYLVLSLLGTIRKRLVDLIFFVSLSFFIYTLVNDILLANTANAAYNNYLSQISFQLFIFAMAVLIILQWVNNYKERLKLESSLRFKNRVLSVIAHDLKNPIASVAQFSDLLISKPELSSKEHVIRSLGESSQAAVTLLDNLLYWGRSESGMLHIAAVRMEIEPVVTEVVALFQHMAVQKEITVTSDVESRLAAWADPILINIVLRNLLANAIKFTHKDGTIHIRAWKEENNIFCAVADTGIGMKSEFLEQFQKDGYLSSSTGTDQEIGTGMGLQLVKDLLNKNEGKLSIESAPDKGSTFTFSLPVAKEVSNEDKENNP